MLKGISPLLSPELLAALATMGHGEEIVFCDAHFPATRHARYLIRADGIRIPDLLSAVIPLIELDTYATQPVAMMAPVDGDTIDQELLSACRSVLFPTNGPEADQKIEWLERFAFYQRSEGAFAIVVTGETRKYGNVLITKGVFGA